MGPDLCWKKGAEVKVAHKKIKEKGAEVNVADKKIKEKAFSGNPLEEATRNGNKKPQQEKERQPRQMKNRQMRRKKMATMKKKKKATFFIRIHNPRKKSTFEILWRRMPGKLQTSWPMR